VPPSDCTPPPPGNVNGWIEAARLGSPDALGQLLAYCRAYLLAVANERLEPELQAKVGASDVVQDTFLEAQRDFSRFRGGSEEELLAWLRQILLHNLANLSRQYRQTDKRQIDREIHLSQAPAGELLQALADDDSTPSGHALRQERDKSLEQALAQLPEHLRNVLQWRAYELCSFEEIGRRLGRSAGAARKQWARAVERLQQILGPADEAS
jgi:RNA polymerase sigma-70 factor, ECF subfamily